MNLTLATNATLQSGRAAPEKPAGDDAYEPVSGLDQATVQCVRACESEAAAKTASDYAHIIWAYGVIWSLFAIYGVMLWRRTVGQRRDIDELSRRLAAR